MRRVKVKICGVTREADAVAAVELGADFLGLNFYPASPRAVDPRRALEIRRAVGGRVPLVGVFVNHRPAEIEEISAAVGLDLVQLHGDEGPEIAAAFGGRAIKVFRRADPPSADELAAYPDVWGFLFDAPHAAFFGGGGRPWAWGAVGGLALAKPAFLAGGIRPGNAALASRASGAWGIDVCSGVESAPGVKDRDLIDRLIRELEVEDGQALTAP